jgi:hypothetical protein
MVEKKKGIGEQFVKDEQMDSIFRLRHYDRYASSKSDYMYWGCRRAGSYDAKKKSKKSKCPAYFTLKISDSGSTTYQGNFEHNHRDDDLQVVSKKAALEVKKWLESGISVDKCLEKLEERPQSERTKGRPIFKKDIYRIQRFFAPGTIDLKKTEMHNVYKLLEDSCIRSFNLRKVYGDESVPDHLAHKEVYSQEPLIISMDEDQREFFRKNPNTLMGDSTHCTNRAGMLLASLNVLNYQGAAVPVMQAFVKTESEVNIRFMLDKLRELEPEAFSKVKTVVSDLNNAWKQACIKEMGSEVNFVKCAWHIERAWTKNAPKDGKMLSEWKELRLVTDEKKLNALYHSFQEYWMKHGTTSDKRAWDYFNQNYWYNGSKTNPKEWAKCFIAGAVGHNLYIERYHKELKSRWFYPFFRMDQCLDGLKKYNRHVAYSEMGKMAEIRNVRPSQAQRRFKNSHTTPDGFSLTPLLNGDYIVEETAEERHFVLTENELHQCDLSKCLVLCEKCPAGPSLNCAHSYRCTCRTYSEENQCEHLHLRNTLANGSSTTDIATEHADEPVEGSSSSQQSRTQFPVTTRKRIHSPVTQFPPKPKRRKTGKSGRNGKYAVWSMDSLLEKYVDKEVNEEYGWAYLACYDSKDIMEGADKLEGHKKEMAKEKYELAKEVWSCNGCSELTIEKVNSHFVKCDHCDFWYHGLCCDIDINQEDIESVIWDCLRCRF